MDNNNENKNESNSSNRNDDTDDSLLIMKEPVSTRKRIGQVSNEPRRKSSRIAATTGASSSEREVSDRRTSSRRKSNDVDADAKVNKQEDDASDDDDAPSSKRGKFVFDGVTYSTYQEMVQAKRERNQKYLLESGLLEKQPKVSKRRVLAPPTMKSQQLPRRQSSRLAGKDADNIFVEKEGPHGKFEINGLSTDGNNEENNVESLKFYRNRINDGSNLSIREVVSNLDSKWSNEKNVQYFEQFLQSLQSKEFVSPEKVSSNTELLTSGSYSPTSVRQIVTPSPVMSTTPAVVVSSPSSSLTTNSASSWTLQQINTLSGDDERCVAKVCPDRIYGIAIHPGTDRLIVSAGDKIGNIGLWNVDQQAQSHNNKPEIIASNGEIPSPITSSDKEEDIGIYMFKYHTGAAACLQWTSSGNALMSTSYDGTVRWFDIEKQVSEQIFATYDDSDEFKHQVGYGLDIGYRYWTQYGCLDHRSSNDKCIFLSTSVGTAMHLDLRMRGRITFHEELSEKKINSLSLHPNGYSLLTGGLDNTVRVWDIRNFGNSHTTGKKSSSSVRAIAECNLGKSINSIFFAPSGQYAVATTMANRIEVFNNLHLVGQSDSVKTTTKKTAAAAVPVKPTISKYHDNNTGRWLTTFMGVFHPSYDLFCIGSMQRPRCIELYDPSQNCSLVRSITGDAVTSVSSRCCFHPRTDRIILAGGNSSGRVTVIR